MTNQVTELKQELLSLATPQRAEASEWFFKTGPGEYGEGDIFVGITMPDIRKTVREYIDLPLSEVEQLLSSKEHEFRMGALIILVAKFKRGDHQTRENIYRTYLANTKYINNWDLVDVSAEHIIGAWLRDKPAKMSTLKKLAKSKSLWERRIAIISTFHYIKQGEPDETLQIAEMLLDDDQDLMHKAVGWMLREVGKRCSEEIEERFLEQYAHDMPRTMLRYAIEKFPPNKRRYYLEKTS